VKVRQSLEKIRSLNSRKNSESTEEVAVRSRGRVKSDFFLVLDAPSAFLVVGDDVVSVRHQAAGAAADGTHC